MDHLHQLQRAIDYIEDHLSEEIMIEEVAKIAGFSRWHFQIVFSATVGDSLKEYIRKRRLTLAMTDLGKTDKRILDIALCAGFESQESFTRAFKNMFGKNPGEVRKIGIQSIRSLHKPKITMEYLDHLYRGVNMQPEIKFVEEKKVIGVGANFISARSPDHNNETVIPALWQDYMARGEEITSRLSWTDMGIVMSISKSSLKSHPDEMYYMAATETSGIDEIPSGMIAQIIPAGNYAIFTHKGTLDKLSHTMNYIYGSWLAKSERELRDAPELEIYGPRFKPNSEDSELDIYIPIL